MFLESCSQLSSSLDTQAKNYCWGDTCPSDLFWATAWIKEPRVHTKFRILSRVNFTFSLIQLQPTKTGLVPYCFKVALYRVGSQQLRAERINWKANQIYNEIFLKSLKEGLIFIHCYLKYSKIFFYYSATFPINILCKLQGIPCSTLQIHKSIPTSLAVWVLLSFFFPPFTPFSFFACQKIFPAVVLFQKKKFKYSLLVLFFQIICSTFILKQRRNQWSQKESSWSLKVFISNRPLLDWVQFRDGVQL